MSGDLQGRRVVVTRAADRADALAGLLTARGAEPVVVPLIEIVPAADGLSALDAALAHASFDWIVVTSPTAAALLLERAGVVGRVLDTETPRLAAIGAVTAATLSDREVPVALVPERQRADGLVEVFPSGPGRVLVVQAVDGAATLSDGLQAKAWQVEVVRPYRSVPAQPTVAQQASVAGADAVLFASGSAARGWVEMFGTVTPPIVVAIGPETALATERAGLHVTVVADDHSLEGLVDALERAVAAAG